MNRSRYKHETPLDLHSDEYLEPLGTGPLLPEPRPQPHKFGCWCVRCHNAGVDYGVYLHNKRMQEL